MNEFFEKRICCDKWRNWLKFEGRRELTRKKNGGYELLLAPMVVGTGISALYGSLSLVFAE